MAEVTWEEAFHTARVKVLTWKKLLYVVSLAAFVYGLEYLVSPAYAGWPITVGEVLYRLILACVVVFFSETIKARYW